jgi:hypothetical protein
MKSPVFHPAFIPRPRLIDKVNPWWWWQDVTIPAGVATPSAFSAWTGSATRTAIATGSATVTNCAEAIKALIDDLKSIGVLP